MRLAIRDRQNLLFGILLISIGVVGFVAGANLPMGEAVHMGSGYMPKVLSGLLLGFGIVISGMAFTIDGPREIGWMWRPLIVVLGSFVLFGLAIERLGLAITIVITMLVARLATPGGRWHEAVVYAVLMAAACSLLFRYALGLPLPIWPV